MIRYLDPKNDLAFKRVFGEHKHLCMSLLNSMLPLKSPIVNIEYQSPEMIPELDILRFSLVDVRCTDEDGRQFLVEMQMHWAEGFKSRVLLNASKAYVWQLDKGMPFKLLKPVYALSFVNDIFEKSPEMANEYYHHYKIVNIKDTERQIEGLEFIFIELPKFEPNNRAENKLFELWMRFLTEINEKTDIAPKELLENKYTCEALQYMEVFAFTKAQLYRYDKVFDSIMVEETLLSDAWEKGEATGEAKVLERMVIDAKCKGFTIEQIQSFTNLTIENINQILINNNLS
jgi:predicted transposase/invertase (TIGR01784 family)